MEEVVLARWQFAITSVYHFFFVPLTIGLVWLVALMETLYVRSGDETYLRMTKFWGKLFLINFAVGVVTGIVMEFQFGMSWSEYSRFVGSVFGAPLAIEALLAFFLESTFLGIWIFGWERLSRGLHALTIWLVAVGSTVSAFWILVANSFMQQPVGYALEEGRAVMTDFWGLVSNPPVLVQFPHVIAGSMTTGAFFVLAVSSYNLWRKTGAAELFRRSFTMAAVYGMIGVALVGLVGHTQAQHMVRTQPMKIAAAEALWESEDPASFSLLTIGNEAERRDVVAIRIPNLLSLMAYNRLDGEVQGIKNLQETFVERYGPGDYVPPVAISYWAFRLMVGAGLLMGLLALLALVAVLRNRVLQSRRLIAVLPFALVLPYLAHSTGWILTEVGRQPWIVYGLMFTEDANSPTVNTAMILISLVVLTVVYTALIAADIYLLARNARKAPEAATSPTG
jgi:cytochrome d ubiquinol oxidase subunit I